MGCGSSTAVGVLEPNGGQASKANKKRKTRPPTPGPKSIAFEVRLDDADDDQRIRASSIRSRLPKRLQRLEEHPNSSPITAEEILERQKLAEKRRKSAIEERVLKSKYFLDKVLVANKSDSSRSNSSVDKSNGKGANGKAANGTSKSNNKKDNKKDKASRKTK